MVKPTEPVKLSVRLLMVVPAVIRLAEIVGVTLEQINDTVVCVPDAAVMYTIRCAFKEVDASEIVTVARILSNSVYDPELTIVLLLDWNSPEVTDDAKYPTLRAVIVAPAVVMVMPLAAKP